MEPIEGDSTVPAVANGIWPWWITNQSRNSTACLRVDFCVGARFLAQAFGKVEGAWTTEPDAASNKPVMVQKPLRNDNTTTRKRLRLAARQQHQQPPPPSPSPPQCLGRPEESRCWWWSRSRRVVCAVPDVPRRENSTDQLKADDGEGNGWLNRGAATSPTKSCREESGGHWLTCCRTNNRLSTNMITSRKGEEERERGRCRDREMKNESGSVKKRRCGGGSGRLEAGRSWAYHTPDCFNSCPYFFPRYLWSFRVHPLSENSLISRLRLPESERERDRERIWHWNGLNSIHIHICHRDRNSAVGRGFLTRPGPSSWQADRHRRAEKMSFFILSLSLSSLLAPFTDLRIDESRPLSLPPPGRYTTAESRTSDLAGKRDERTDQTAKRRTAVDGDWWFDYWTWLEPTVGVWYMRSWVRALDRTSLGRGSCRLIQWVARVDTKKKGQQVSSYCCCCC